MPARGSPSRPAWRSSLRSCHSPRSWCSALGGLAAGAGLAAGIVAVAFGGHLPATRLQAKLVTPLSVPNVLGVLTGHGGSDAAVRSIAEVVLVLAIAAGALVVWRRRERLPVAAGAVMLAAALTLSWTMPWYVWWSLPFAALARSRVLVGGVIALTLWLGIGAVPQMPKLIHAVGYYPTRSATGHANHVYTERLLK